MILLLGIPVHERFLGNLLSLCARAHLDVKDPADVGVNVNVCVSVGDGEA